MQPRTMLKLQVLLHHRTDALLHRLRGFSEYIVAGAQANQQERSAATRWQLQRARLLFLRQQASAIQREDAGQAVLCKRVRLRDCWRVPRRVRNPALHSP